MTQSNSFTLYKPTLEDFKGLTPKEVRRCAPLVETRVM
jgi:hypothetical protein